MGGYKPRKRQEPAKPSGRGNTSHALQCAAVQCAHVAVQLAGTRQQCWFRSAAAVQHSSAVLCRNATIVVALLSSSVLPLALGAESGRPGTQWECTAAVCQGPGRCVRMCAACSCSTTGALHAAHSHARVTVKMAHVQLWVDASSAYALLAHAKCCVHQHMHGNHPTQPATELGCCWPDFDI